jgi:hypothetical protein
MKKSIEVKLYEPARIQRMFSRINWVDKPFISLAAWGRQSGKSVWMRMDAFAYCMNNKRKKVIWLSPIQAQSNLALEELFVMFESNRELWDHIVEKVDRRYPCIYFKNGSRLWFKSMDSGDNLRGGTYHRVYMDEAAYMKEEDIKTIVFPYVTRTKGRIVMVSTFKGRNWFWDWYLEGQDSDNKDRIISMKATYQDLTEFPEVIEHVENNIRPSMSKAEFAQEYLCNPTDSKSLFMDVEARVYTDELTTEDLECRRFVGIDVGFSQDYTVLTCINEHGKVIDIDRFHYKDSNMSNDQFRERIYQFLRKHETWLDTAHFERNNNQFLYDELFDGDELFRRTTLDFLVTPTTKSAMINHLIMLFDRGQIQIPKDKTLIQELYDFRGKMDLNTGTIRFAGDKGKHDDMVMSLAHAAYARFETLDGGTIEWHRG